VTIKLRYRCIILLKILLFFILLFYYLKILLFFVNYYKTMYKNVERAIEITEVQLIRLNRSLITIVYTIKLKYFDNLSKS